MKRVLIIGANGKIGKILSRKLKDEADFEPVAMLRKPEQASFFDDLGVESHVASIEGSVDEIAKIMKETDAVVFTAGSGGSTGHDKTLTVDLDGAVKSMEAARLTDVKRFIMVSALNADDRDLWAASGLEPYYVAKHYADFVLKTTDLDYTILRPGRLLDEPGTGMINITYPEKEDGVSREDVAGVIVQALKQKDSIGKIIAFNQGKTPLEKALSQG
ncbi:SDR family oxidoreductase [Sinomicrobium oceani]|uniref:SDR family oxidoreductase n=1 Tax=Sinomicrobium oceani TaxID=1150368 RepID=UPI00227B54AE|nr:SDR family oxidoreductase [Sinomicrobium oceani]